MRVVFRSAKERPFAARKGDFRRGGDSTDTLGCRLRDHWYCQVESEQFGPFSWDQMRAMAAEGRLVPESQVRRADDQRWFEASKIPGLLKAVKPSEDVSVRRSTATESKVAVAAKETATAASVTAPAAKALEISENPVKTTPGKALAAEKINGKTVTSKLPLGQRAGDGSSSKRQLPRPASNRGAGAGSAATDALREQPAPPPPPPQVKQPDGPPKLPLPEPALDASPLGIVVAPPVAELGKGSKPAGPSGLAAAAEKDAHGLSPLLVGGVLGGVALVLVAIGGGVVAWQNLQKDADRSTVAAKSASQPADEKPAISEAELDAILGPIKPPEPVLASKKAKAASPAIAAADSVAAADSAAADAARAQAAAAEKMSPAERKVLAAKKLLAAQSRWTPIEGVVIRGKFTQVQVAQIWLASDEKGTRVDPALPRSALAASGLPAEATARSSPGKYVFVDVRISNSGDVPRKYTSWNTGGNITAILADGKGEPLPLVPPEDTPSVPRLLSLNIPAGEMFGDILVFEAPKEPFESLKLLLSQAAFAGPGRHFALEVPFEFLFKEAEELPPQTALAADDDVPAEGESRPVRKKTLDPNAPPTPPSIDEFTEQLKNATKMLNKQNATDVPPKEAPDKEAQNKDDTPEPEKQE